MQLTNEQVWQRFSEAWAKRDVDGLMALVTDDIIYGASVGPEPGATFRGRDEVRRGFDHMLRHDQVLREHAGPVVIVAITDSPSGPTTCGWPTGAMDASVGSTSWNSQTVGWPGKTRSARSDASVVGP